LKTQKYEPGKAGGYHKKKYRRRFRYTIGTGDWHFYQKNKSRIAHWTDAWLHCHFPAEKKMNTDNDKAPLFKSWNQWYFFVIAVLVVLINLFNFFTKYFS